MSIRVIRPGEGEMVGVGPIRIRIIEDGSHTQHRIGLIEATIPPGPAAPPQHVHREHDEVFIVTAGKLRFTSGAVSVEAEEGAVVVAPAGTPHTFSNPFDAPTTFLCSVTPDLYIQYFRDSSTLAVNAHGMPTDPAEVGRIMARYATAVVRPG